MHRKYVTFNIFIAFKNNTKTKIKSTKRLILIHIFILTFRHFLSPSPCTPWGGVLCNTPRGSYMDHRSTTTASNVGIFGTI